MNRPPNHEYDCGCVRHEGVEPYGERSEFYCAEAQRLLSAYREVMVQIDAALAPFGAGIGAMGLFMDHFRKQERAAREQEPPLVFKRGSAELRLASTGAEGGGA